MTWRAPRGIVCRALSDGGLFVVDARSGDALGLSRTAAETFELLREGRPFEAIVDELHARYGVDRRRLAQDVAELVETLSRARILERRAADGEEPDAPLA